MRVLIVLVVFGALLLGLVGLLMSACGGGFLFASLIQRYAPMIIFIFALPSLAIGIRLWLIHKDATLTRRNLNRDDTDTRG